jgi:hypothetical protein
VALAGDHHDVTGTRRFEGDGDRPPPVRFDPRRVVAPEAGQHLLDDRVRMLEARVVRGDDHVVGAGGRRLAHAWPLRRVAVAAAAEHDVHPLLPRELTGRRQRLGDAIGGVRVVDRDQERLARVDELEAPRHRLGRLQALGDELGLDAQLRGDRRGRDRVHEVEPADEPRRHAHAAPGERRAGRRDRHRAGVAGHVPDGRDLRGVAQQPTVRVVEAHDRAVGATRLEEHGLGVEVGLHGAVVVEVVLAEVGEAGDREPRAVDAVLDQRVRRHLDGHGCSGTGEGSQPGLELGRLGRGTGPRQGSDHPARATGGLEDGGDEVADGGFAVRAGHADDRDALRRVPVESRRDEAHRGAHRRHEELGHRQIEPPLGQEGDRTGLHRGRREVVAVGLAAGHAAEERAGLGLGRVMGHREDLDGGRIDVAFVHDEAREPGARPERGEELVEAHGHPPWSSPVGAPTPSVGAVVAVVVAGSVDGTCSGTGASLNPFADSETSGTPAASFDTEAGGMS